MKKLPRKRTIVITILIAGVCILLLNAMRFIHHRLLYASTDAVFIRTDSLVNLGFDGVEGRIVSMAKNEGETVSAGEQLAEIDARQFKLEVTRLEAELEKSQSEKARLELSRTRLARESELNEAIAKDQAKQVQAEMASIEAKEASVKAIIEQHERDRKRYEELVESQAASAYKLEDINTQLASRREEGVSLQKQVQALTAAAAAARKKIDLAVSSRIVVEETEQAISAQAQNIKALAASLAQARDRLDKCKLISPINGRVARRFVSSGNVVKEGRAVYALVDPSDVFAVALLEENKLKGVKTGAPVELRLDAYPDKLFKGKVQDVMPASAATFSLVPRDISAGEFTKVAQRIPVRIALTEGDLSLLRVGLGGEVEIKRQQ